MRLLLLILLIKATLLYAQTDNDIDNGYKKIDVEHGKHFYDDSIKKKKEKIDKKKKEKISEKDILEEMLNELKEQKAELKKIKLFINPNEAKMIINEKGEECLSNTSVDCFLLPIIQEARNVPAFYKFIKNPTPENATIWLKIQAKLFNHYNKIGFALKFAALNGDENTYPVNAQGIYTTPKDNINNEQYRDRILQILDEKKDDIGTLIFLGKSKNIEQHWGYSSISRIAFKKGKYFNIALVFDSNESKQQYDKYYESIIDKKLSEEYKNLPKIVNNKIFEKYNINITPTALAVYKDKERKENFSIISRGYLTQKKLIHAYQNYLVYNDIVEPKEFHSAKIWDVKLRNTDEK